MEFTDNELINQINSSDESLRDAALRYIYIDSGWTKMAEAYILERGLEKASEEIITESLILFDRKIRRGEFKGSTTLRTFFLAIVKWLSLKMYSDNLSKIDEVFEIDDIDLDNLVQEIDRKAILHDLLGQIGEECQSLLLSYRLLSPIEDIAKEHNITIDQAKKKMYRCRLKLRDLIISSPELMEQLKNILKSHNDG